MFKTELELKILTNRGLFYRLTQSKSKNKNKIKKEYHRKWRSMAKNSYKTKKLSRSNAFNCHKN